MNGYFSKARSGSLVLTLLLALAGLSHAVAAEPPADAIFNHGEIYTPKGWAQAIAVRRGVMVAVGTDAQIEAFRGPATREFDLKGAAVLPGLHDMHVHPMYGGFQSLECRFTQGSSMSKVLEAVKTCAATKKKGEWIVGGQWDVTSLKATPDRKLLDKVAPDNPVLLGDISGHSGWVNTMALRIAGVKLDASTRNPVNGIYERDAAGIPTGVLRETAVEDLQRSIPPRTPEENARALDVALKEMLSFGITSLTDAAVDGETLAAYAALSDKGLLKQHVKGCMVWSPGTGANAANEDPAYIVQRNLYARERFAPRCIKMFLDGVPTDSHTAALLHPYVGARPDDPRARGMLKIPPAILNAAVTRFDAEGLTVKFHAAGDGAVREGLDAIAAARKANGFSGQLHEVGHNSLVDKADIPRARAIGATFEMSPYLWFMTPLLPDNIVSVGPERMKRWIPVKEAIDAGGLVDAGSDWPVVPSVSPWIAIETLVTRQVPGGGGEVIAPDERITLKQAVDLFTVNGARELRDRDREGALETGLRADFIVLDRNPFRIPVTQVHETRVKLTVIDGEVVYRAPAAR